MVGTFHRSGASLSYSLLRPLVRAAVKSLAWSCAVSSDAQATAQAALGGTYELVFNGIDTERFAKATAWPTDGPTIVFIGRHEPRKGVETLLAAFERLPTDARLWMVGQGPQTGELKQRTIGNPRIEWLGRISDSEVASRLRGAEVCCAPSLHGESFGVVLLEAMTAHTAIVASDIPAYRKVTGDGRDALLVPPGDVDALAQALRRVLEERGLEEELAIAGEARAGDFAMDRLADRYVQIYTEVNRPRRGTR
jgi:phosphatidylinositol alpha-mannosyltransferase